MVKISNTVIKNPSQSRVGSVALSFSLCLSTIFVATRRRARARGRERLGAEARRGVPRRRRVVERGVERVVERGASWSQRLHTCLGRPGRWAITYRAEWREQNREKERLRSLARRSHAGAAVLPLSLDDIAFRTGSSELRGSMKT